MEGKPQRNRRFRQKVVEEENDDNAPGPSGRAAEESLAQTAERSRLEEIKLMQKARRKTGGTNAETLAKGLADAVPEPSSEEGDEGPMEFMGAFSKAKTVISADQDPQMEKYIEQELAKRLGKDVGNEDQEDPETKRKRLEAEMYQIPEEYKSSLGADVVIPGMNAVITEVPLSAADRLRNIEEVENMKRRMMGSRETSDYQTSAALPPKRREFVPAFGKQAVRDKGKSRDEMEEQAKRMKYVSERRPALPSHRTK